MAQDKYKITEYYAIHGEHYSGNVDKYRLVSIYSENNPVIRATSQIGLSGFAGEDREKVKKDFEHFCERFGVRHKLVPYSELCEISKVAQKQLNDGKHFVEVAVKKGFYEGTFSVIDSINHNGQNLYLMKHDDFDIEDGNAIYVIVDSNNNVIMDDTKDGFSNYDDKLEALVEWELYGHGRNDLHIIGTSGIDIYINSYATLPFDFGFRDASGNRYNVYEGTINGENHIILENYNGDYFSSEELTKDYHDKKAKLVSDLGKYEYKCIARLDEQTREYVDIIDKVFSVGEYQKLIGWKTEQILNSLEELMNDMQLESHLWCYSYKMDEREHCLLNNVPVVTVKDGEDKVYFEIPKDKVDFVRRKNIVDISGSMAEKNLQEKISQSLAEDFNLRRKFM